MEITLQILLTDSFAGVMYGLQEGKGSGYKTIQRQSGGEGILSFQCSAEFKWNAAKEAVFTGPFCQGPPKERFLYIDIGTYSGFTDSISGGRLKIPLTGIDNKLLISLKEGDVLQTEVSAVGKNGKPDYGTVKPFKGWVRKT